ncbi:hypothetical protein IT407_05085 [Candidatus Uhrbacteria bacterium]|nr:hypothetical protein [Candidatus Uhrbacteria bacterium]
MKDKRQPLILLADDDSLLLHGLHRQVVRWTSMELGRDAEHVRIQKFLSPSEASLAVLRQSEKEFSVVMLITDGDMPEFDGPAFARSVKSIFENRLVSVVIFSGTIEDYRDSISKEGWSAVLKPDLEGKLRHHLVAFLKTLTF